MPKLTNKLTARSVASLKVPGRYGDGLGLWLQIADGGSKSWLFRYMRHGRARQMGLGPLHTVSLGEARERARRARQSLLDGLDPIELRRKARDDARAITIETMPFKEAASRFIDVHARTWRNKKHRQQWGNTLKTYAFPTLGTRPIAAIDGALITEALYKIWTTRPETARRTKQRIERIVRWVKDGMPLPVQGTSRRQRHHAALPFVEVPAFMGAVREHNSISARALEFTILTAARTGEVVRAKWSEIELDTAVWTVPEDRMKGGKEHEVPLSTRAIEILSTIPRERGSPYVFPGAKEKLPLSNMAMLEFLRGIRDDGLTVHGFRSTFRDWAGDQTNFARDVIEHALAHKLPDRVEAAYRRSTALEKRRKLMEAWSIYCESPSDGCCVVPIGRVR